MAFFFLLKLADKDAQKGKKSVRKTTRAGGSDVDLQKIAQEQQAKLEKEREERKEQIKAAKEAAATAAAAAPETSAASATTKAPATSKAAKVSEPSKYLIKHIAEFTNNSSAGKSFEIHGPAV